MLPEDDLEPTGLAEDEVGERVPLGAVPASEEARDCLELRLFTEITDGIDAARVAAAIEQRARRAPRRGGPSRPRPSATGRSPYNYELAVTVVPAADPVEALRAIAEAGEARLARLPRRRLALRPLVERDARPRRDPDRARGARGRDRRSSPGRARPAGPKRSGRSSSVAVPDDEPEELEA